MKRDHVRVTTTSILVPSNLSREHPLTKDRNMAHAARYLKHAGEIGSDIVLLPECFATKGMLQAFTCSRASYMPMCEEVPGGEVSDMAAGLARKYGMYVIAPIYERQSGKMYNSAAIFDRRGRFVGKYQKIHLPPPGEAKLFAPGDEAPVFELDFGPVACCICWDINFPELARSYALRGAKILFWPTMWGDTIDYQLAYMKGQALANVMYLVGANYCMPVKGGHPGQSAVFDPSGRLPKNQLSWP